MSFLFSRPFSFLLRRRRATIDFRHEPIALFDQMQLNDFRRRSFDRRRRLARQPRRRWRLSTENGLRQRLFSERRRRLLRWRQGKQFGRRLAARIDPFENSLFVPIFVFVRSDGDAFRSAHGEKSSPLQVAFDGFVLVASSFGVLA